MHSAPLCWRIGSAVRVVSKVFCRSRCRHSGCWDISRRTRSARRRFSWPKGYHREIEDHAKASLRRSALLCIVTTRAIVRYTRTRSQRAETAELQRLDPVVQQVRRRRRTSRGGTGTPTTARSPPQCQMVHRARPRSRGASGSEGTVAFGRVQEDSANRIVPGGNRRVRQWHPARAGRAEPRHRTQLDKRRPAKAEGFGPCGARELDAVP